MSTIGATVVLGEHEFGFEELPIVEAGNPGWAHHGVAVLEDDSVVACAPDHAVLVRIGADGHERSRREVDLVELHGIRAFLDRGEPRLFVADNGHKKLPDHPTYGDRREAGRVVALGLDGALQLELLQPEIEPYAERDWHPCAVAVDEEAFGGGGDIFVADGYGESLVHRFSSAGEWIATFDGAASGTAFATPHDIIVDRRSGSPELYVADRANRRVVVLGLDGSYRRTVADGELTSPSGLATVGELLFVAELHGRLVALDREDQLLGELGAHDDHERPGWPNALDDDGNTVAYQDPPGPLFNSPHGLATNAHGALFVSEWRIGGRLVKLTPRNGGPG